MSAGNNDVAVHKKEGHSFTLTKMGSYDDLTRVQHPCRVLAYNQRKILPWWRDYPQRGGKSGLGKQRRTDSGILVKR